MGMPMLQGNIIHAKDWIFILEEDPSDREGKHSGHWRIIAVRFGSDRVATGRPVPDRDFYWEAASLEEFQPIAMEWVETEGRRIWDQKPEYDLRRHLGGDTEAAIVPGGIPHDY